MGGDGGGRGGEGGKGGQVRMSMWAVCRIKFVIDIPHCIVLESNIKYV